MHSYLFLNFKPGSHMPPTYLRFICRLQRTMFSDLFSGLPAHLCWIAVVLKLARNANQIGAIFISNMDRIVLLKCPFLLTLVLMMRYIRRKDKLEKMRTKRMYWMQPMLQGRKKITGPVSYFVRQVGTSLHATLSSAILNVRNCGKN